MMASKKRRDPFSYFGCDLGDSDISSSEEGSDGESEEIKSDLSFISKPDSVGVGKDKDPVLPKAEDIFKTVAKPEFLSKAAKVVNWDKLTKNDIDQEEEPEKRTNAMPPPKFYEPSTEHLKPTLGDPDKDSSSLKRPIEGEETGNKKVKS